MEVKYFGKIAELVGQESEQLNLVSMSVSEFKERLFEKYQNLSSETIQIAVNLKVQENNFVIKQNDIIAILPPFSGG